MAKKEVSTATLVVLGGLILGGIALYFYFKKRPEPTEPEATINNFSISTS